MVCERSATDLLDVAANWHLIPDGDTTGSNRPSNRSVAAISRLALDDDTTGNNRLATDLLI